MKRIGSPYQQEWLEFCENDYDPMTEGVFGYLYTLRRFADACRAATVLEIGVGEEAMSSVAFAYSMASRGGGTLISVEVDNGLPHGIYRRELARVGVDWRVMHEDSLTASVSDTVDLLYIDGDKKNTVPDFLRYSPLVKRGGYVVIDDYPFSHDVVAARGAITEDFLEVQYDYAVDGHPAGSNGHLIWRKP